jgi:hypothetical protein
MEFYDYTLRETPETPCAVCRETLATPHQPLFRRTEDGWQQGHHHGSMDAPDCWHALSMPCRGVDTMQCSLNPETGGSHERR